MSNPTTITSPATLSDLTGAYDVAHWQTEVRQLKTGTGVLTRGSVLSAVATDAGKLTLTAAGSEATAYGVLLDASIDTGAPNSTGTVTASVAREGSFRGAALITKTGTNVATLAAQLRDIGIFVEGPIAAGAALLAADEESEEKPKGKGGGKS